MEGDESFGVTLTSSDSIDLIGGTTTIVIVDDDGKSYVGWGLKPPSKM